MVLFSMHAYATIGIISITNPTTTNDEYGNPTISNCDGTIDLVADGNAGPFTFAWSNGATTEDITNGCQGYYSVTVTNAFGCSKVLDAYMKACAEMETINMTRYAITQIDKETLDGGGVTVVLASIPEGTLFKWTNEAGEVVSLEQNLQDVGPGRYCLSITGGCVYNFYKCFDIPLCAYASSDIPDRLSFELTHPCPQMTNGHIDMTINYGAEPYKVEWIGNSSEEDLRFVREGYYQVIVTDRNGCKVSEIVHLTPSIGSVGLQEIHHACSGTGSIAVRPVPEGNYHFTWSNGFANVGLSSTLTNLDEGSYCVTILDKESGCKLEECWTIGAGLDPALIQLSDFNFSLCNWECTGQFEIALENSAGINTTGASYAWSGPDNFNMITSNPNLMGLCSGDYTVTVTLADGCTTEKNFNMCCCYNDGTQYSDCKGIDATQPAGVIRIRDHIEIPSVNNNFFGTIDLSETVGVLPEGRVFFEWERVGDPSFQSASSIITGLSPGTYCVTVSGNCNTSDDYIYNHHINSSSNNNPADSEVKCFSIGESARFTTRGSCKGGSSGYLDIDFAEMVEPPFEMFLNDVPINYIDITGIPSYNIRVEGIPIGSHTLTVKDANNYTINLNFEMQQDDSNLPPNLKLYDNSFIRWGANNQCDNDDQFIKIIVDWHGTSFSSNTQRYFDPIGVEWPLASGGSYSAINLTHDLEDFKVFGTVSGPDHFDISASGEYLVALFDANTGCRLESCFVFDDHSSVIPYELTHETILLPGTDYSIQAYTGCYGHEYCRKECDEQYLRSYHVNDIEKFQFEPTNPNAPCDGGLLRLKCADPEITINITTPGELFTEYPGETIHNDLNDCFYGVGCLFYDLPFFLYPGDLPIYVEDRKVKSGCSDPPTFSPGSTTSDCDGVLTIDWADKATCKANTICYGSDGAVTLSFGEDRSTFSHYCQRSDGLCYAMYSCPETGGLFSDNIPIDCETLGPDEDVRDCIMARPQERTSEESENRFIDPLAENELVVYPIPFSNYIYLRYETSVAGSSTIYITDITGKRIYNSSFSSETGQNQKLIQFEEALEPGIYFLTLDTPEGKRYYKKIITLGE
jgi:Secretion system C-terminal sorting domain